MTGHRGRFKGAGTPSGPTITTPAFTSPATLTVVAGAPYSFTVSATGSPRPSLGILSGSLPPGATFLDNKDGTATVSATSSTAGSYSIGILAYNGLAAGQTLAISVSAVVPTYNVPSNINATGASDVSLKWQTFIQSQSPGATINVPPTAVYLCDGTIAVHDIPNLTINFNGATFKQATFRGIDTQSGTALVAGGIPALNRGMFTFTRCDNITLNDANLVGAMNLGNLDGEYALASAMDDTSPNLMCSRKTFPHTRNDIQVIKGSGSTRDKLRTTGTWVSAGITDANSHGKIPVGIFITGFANSANNGFHPVHDVPGAVTTTDIELDTIGAVVNEAAGVSVVVYAGTSTSGIYSMAQSGGQFAAFPLNYPRIHRSSGSFITDGWKVGMVFQIYGFSNIANDGGQSHLGHLVCLAVTASDLYFIPDNGHPVNENTGANITLIGRGELGAYLINYETQHAMRFIGCHTINLQRMTTRFFLGDGATFLSTQGTEDRWCEHVLVEDCNITDQGRQGLGPGAVRTVVIRGNTFDRIRRTMIDFEPNGVGWGWQDCWVIDNIFGENELSGINLKTYGETTQGMVISGSVGIRNINVGKQHPTDMTGLSSFKNDVWIVNNTFDNPGGTGLLVIGANRVVVRGNTLVGQSGSDTILIQFSQNINHGANTVTPGKETLDASSLANIGVPPSATPPSAPF